MSEEPRRLVAHAPLAMPLATTPTADDDHHDEPDSGQPHDNGADLCANLDQCERQLAPLCDQAAVDLEAERWAREWAVGADYPPLPFSEDDNLLLPPSLTAPILREAALSFPASTGFGSESIGPRACHHLSNAALIALVVILAACESADAWPYDLWFVLIVLLLKPDGGLRLIGLFSTVVSL